METTSVRFFNPALGYQKIKPEIDRAIQSVLERGDLVLRKDLEEFEENLAKYTGKEYAVGVNSGTDALYLSLWALGIKPGDEVIVPSHTFVATAQVVAQLGATPVMVDVEDNLLVSPVAVAGALTKKTKAIIPVHLTGAVADVEDMLAFDTPIIEDAAQALGATGVGFGVTQCYSFYPAKILGAYGDAGAITTDDEDLAALFKDLRHHYKKDYSEWGINSRLDNMQAAILNVKMQYLAEAQLVRATIAEKYRDGLKDVKDIRLPEYSEGRVWQDYIIRARDEDDRDALFDFLKRQGIETMMNEYPMPVDKSPNALRIEGETLRIPCNENLTDEEVEYVITNIRKYFGM